MNLEDDLRRALRRTTAPAGFAERVVGRLKAAPTTDDVQPAPTYDDVRPAPTTGTVGGRRRWLAAAAVIALLAAGGTRYYQQQQQRAAEAERIEADIRLALRITSEKLELIQRKINDSASEVAR